MNQFDIFVSFAVVLVVVVPSCTCRSLSYNVLSCCFPGISFIGSYLPCLSNILVVISTIFEVSVCFLYLLPGVLILAHGSVDEPDVLSDWLSTVHASFLLCTS